jgi:hypothetical protein
MHIIGIYIHLLRIIIEGHSLSLFLYYIYIRFIYLSIYLILSCLVLSYLNLI